MKSVLRGVGAATIALAFALPVSGQTLLRLDPPEGQVSRYVYSMELNMANPMMPTSGPALSVRADQTLTILGATDEGIRARVAIDSAATTSAIPGAVLPDLSGTSLTVEMDPRGRADERRFRRARRLSGRRGGAGIPGRRELLLATRGRGRRRRFLDRRSTGPHIPRRPGADDRGGIHLHRHEPRRRPGDDHLRGPGGSHSRHGGECRRASVEN